MAASLMLAKIRRCSREERGIQRGWDFHATVSLFGERPDGKFVGGAGSVDAFGGLSLKSTTSEQKIFIGIAPGRIFMVDIRFGAHA